MSVVLCHDGGRGAVVAGASRPVMLLEGLYDMPYAIRMAVGFFLLAIASPVAPSLAQPADPAPLPEIGIGREDAPVTLVQYADLTCPACADFHVDVLPELKARYIDTGKVRLLFRGFPTNFQSMVAMMTVRCVRAEQAFALVSSLFLHQEEWRSAPSFAQQRDKLFAAAQQEAGLTREAFEGCVPAVPKGDKIELTPIQQGLTKAIQSTRDHAYNQLGVKTLPRHFINGKEVAGATLPAFEAAIAAALNP
jgi:protein-disulfide isomerase